MEIIITIIISIIMIGICIILIKNKNIKEEIDLNYKKIIESQKSIDIAINKKEEIYENAINIIKNSNKKKYAKKNILESVIKNKNKKLNLNEKYEELIKIDKEYKDILESDLNLENIKEIKDINYNLKLNEIDLKSSILFFNDSLNNLNKRNKILINKYLENENISEFKEFNIYNSEEFEILKEDKN